MCGIGGFSLSGKSKLSSRRVANVMLTLLEQRGNQASGVAWHSKDGVGFIKNAVAGSRLNLASLPRKADTAILHTRLATHGSINDNRNNHPIISPSTDIALVHNGVIYNHDMIRPEIAHALPPVDSSVIPALIESGSLEALSKLDGDAAIAWLSGKKQGILNIARISHSPLVMAQSKDGSFFFASTESILDEALKRLGIKPAFKMVLQEREGYAIRKGRIIETLSIPQLDPAYEYAYTNSYSKSKFRSATAGNAGALFGDDSYWWDDDDLTPASTTDRLDWEYDFEIFLSEFIEYQPDEFFNYEGYYVGSRQDLVALFEKKRYEQWWKTESVDSCHM